MGSSSLALHCKFQLIASVSLFQNKCNVGYAFINMVSPSHIISFYEVSIFLLAEFTFSSELFYFRSLDY